MIKADVIASFDNHKQEWFEISIPDEYLDDDKTIVNFLLRQLDNVSDLYKISVCWVCDVKTASKFRGVKDSIKHQGYAAYNIGVIKEKDSVAPLNFI